MNKKVLASGAAVALLSVPAMAQNVSSANVDELRQEVERLQSEVEYLKESTKAQRKEAAEEEVEIAGIKTAISAVNKYTWSGDFRYRSEHITTASNLTTPEQTRNRDRIRARFGVSVKVNDAITGKLQLATSGGATNDPRSTNQTLGEGWTRKSIAIDQAYVDWKALSMLNVQVGKMPMPWTRTASYFWDGDITPEGAAVKFSRGALFGSLSYDWLNERHNASATGARGDTKLMAAQFGVKQPIGKVTLTAAVGYFDLMGVQDEVTAVPTGCTATANSTFFNNSTNGNTTRSLNGCTVLASDFNVVNALVQLDFSIGKFPMSVFADYMKNTEAEDVIVSTVNLGKFDTAYAAGITFNKASAAKSWEVGYIYQVGEADAIFGQFHDSDFGDGKTDTDGGVVKASYVPATNWTVSGTYFINKLNNDLGSTANKDLDYKRLQLDLNYRF